MTTKKPDSAWRHFASPRAARGAPVLLLTFVFQEGLQWLRDLLRVLREKCLKVWAHCREEPVPKMIWLILSVLAAEFFLVLLPHGLTFSENSAATVQWSQLITALAVLALFAWFWPHMLRFAGRIVLAGMVTSGFAVLSGVGVAAVLILFAFLLALLVLALGVSLIVSVPVRAAQVIAERFHPTRCSHAECAREGSPTHLCRCGSLHEKLHPGFRGVFFHLCRHQKLPVSRARSLRVRERWAGVLKWLPTLDCRGRTRLRRRCPACEKEIDDPLVGLMDARDVVVIGDVSSGKTTLAWQAIRALEAGFGSANGSKTIAAPRQGNLLAKIWDQFDHGIFPASTAIGDPVEGIGLALQLRGKRPVLLRVFDPNGQVFLQVQHFAALEVMRHACGFILVVDPFDLPKLAPEHRDQTLTRIAGNLVNVVNMLGRCDRDGQCSVPLAVVLTRADELPVDRHHFLAGLCPNHDSLSSAQSDHVRIAFEALGAEPALRTIEAKFTRLCYFAATATGPRSRQRTTSSFCPAGVAAPFQWLFDL